MMRTSIAEWRRQVIGDADGPQFDRLEPTFRSGLIDREKVVSVGAHHDPWCASLDFGRCNCRPDVVVYLGHGRIPLDPAGRIAGSH